MRKIITTASILTAAAWLGAPAAVAAHQGHAGDHGWLWGALQPLLSLDHLVAGLTVLLVGAVAFSTLGRAVAARREGPEADLHR